jgi:hypothetical protein
MHKPGEPEAIEPTEEQLDRAAAIQAGMGLKSIRAYIRPSIKCKRCQKELNRTPDRPVIFFARLDGRMLDEEGLHVGRWEDSKSA